MARFTVTARHLNKIQGALGMGYKIRFLSDCDMPDGHDFTLCVRGAEIVILYRASAVRAAIDPDRAARVLEDSWSAYRALEAELLDV